MKWLVIAVLLNAVKSQLWALDFKEQTWPHFSELDGILDLYESETRQPSDEVSKQVARLIDKTSISEERLRAIPYVLQHLESVISTRWPGSRVIVFGSIEYGLAVTGSDLDCTVLLPHRSDTSQCLIEEATSSLRQYPQLFADLYFIDRVQIPVASFKHTPTQFKVDLTINNFIGIQISKLLRYLLHIDERIYKLAFVVKHWAGVHTLTSIKSLSNYGLLLMVIFYLQRRNMMPSVASLQENANPFFDKEWNIGFCEVEYNIRSDVPLKLLLGEFFEYYADFDYDKYVISTYTGYPIDKRIFADVDKLPDEFRLYVHNVKANISEPLPLENPFVLQDVFIHYNNVGKYVDTRPNSTFITQFRFAAKKFRENNYNFLDQILLFHGK